MIEKQLHNQGPHRSQYEEPIKITKKGFPRFGSHFLLWQTAPSSRFLDPQNITLTEKPIRIKGNMFAPAPHF